MTIAEGVRSIETYAFKGCTGLRRITVPSSVTSIMQNAFSGCDSFVICSSWNAYARTWAEENGIPWEHDQHTPSELPLIPPTEEEPGRTGGTACAECGEVLVAPEGIPALKDLSVLRLPAQLTAIEAEAFENLVCEAIIVPDGCTSIGAHAFRNCKNLVYVRIPASTEIAPDAFEGCENVVIDRVGQ